MSESTSNLKDWFMGYLFSLGHYLKQGFSGWILTSIQGAFLVLTILCVTDVTEASGASEVKALASSVSAYDSPSLTSSQLKGFEVGLKQLNYDELLECIELLDRPVGEVRLTPMITLGEPLVERIEAWEAPAKLLAHQLLEVAPRHTNRWIQREMMYRRGSVTFIEEFGRVLPEIAWDEVKEHYAKYWKFTEGGKNYAVPSLANGIFLGLEKLDGKPGRKFLLDGSYDQEPFAKILQQHALMGMLRAAKSTDELIDFLEWRLGLGKGLSGEFTGYSFRVHMIDSESEISALTLALLAKKDHKLAIDWAEKNEANLDFEWPCQIYGGWVEFWPETKEDVALFATRRRDAIEWLAERVAPDSVAIHNAYFNWRSGGLGASQGPAQKKWLEELGSSKRVEAAKVILRVKEEIWSQNE
jgi:hypothetical protein